MYAQVNENTCLRYLARQMREMLPEPLDYADLIGAPEGSRGQLYVYEDPRCEVISEGAKKLDEIAKEATRLQAQMDEVYANLRVLELALKNNRLVYNGEEWERIETAIAGIKDVCTDAWFKQYDTGYSAEDIEELPL